MFIAELFTIAKVWKQPNYPSVGEQINMCMYICIYIYIYISTYIYTHTHIYVCKCIGFPGSTSGKSHAPLPMQVDIRDADQIPGSKRSPGRGHHNPLHYYFLAESHGQKSLRGCHPQCRTESNTTEATQHAPVCVCACKCVMEYHTTIKRMKICHLQQHRWTWRALCKVK